MAKPVSHIFPLLIITLCCVGLVEGGYQALEHFILDRKLAGTREDSETVIANLGPVAIGKSSADYTIILRRNLFGPPPAVGRIQPEVEPAASLEASSLNVVLMGTVTGETGDQRAFILDKEKREQQLYETGDAIQGAVIKEIQRGKVIVTYNGRDEILDMSEAAKVRPKVQPTPVIPGDGGPSLRNLPVPPQPQQPPTAIQPQSAIQEQQARRRIVRPRIIRPVRNRQDG